MWRRRTETATPDRCGQPCVRHPRKTNAVAPICCCESYLQSRVQSLVAHKLHSPIVWQSGHGHCDDLLKRVAVHTDLAENRAHVVTDGGQSRKRSFVRCSVIREVGQIPQHIENAKYAGDDDGTSRHYQWRHKAANQSVSHPIRVPCKRLIFSRNRARRTPA